MKMRRTLLRYYKRKLYHGRSTFARAVDFLALRLIIFAASYLWFSTIIPNAALSGTLAFIALLIVCVIAELYKSIKLDGFILKERVEIQKRLFNEKLLLLQKSDFSALIKEYLALKHDVYPKDSVVIPYQNTALLTSDAVLFAVRAMKRRNVSDAVIFSVNPPDAETKALASRLFETEKTRIQFVDAKMIYNSDAAESLMPFEDEVEYEEKRLAQASAIGHKKTAMTPGFERIRRYFLIGAILFALSFFVRYSLYYRVLAGVCLSMGGISWWLGALTPKETQI